MNTGNCIHKRRKGDAAVKQKWNYLSVRLGIFIVTGAVLTMLLFIAGWLSAEACFSRAAWCDFSSYAFCFLFILAFPVQPLVRDGARKGAFFPGICVSGRF